MQKSHWISNLWRLGPNKPVTLIIWLISALLTARFVAFASVTSLGSFRLLILANYLILGMATGWVIWIALHFSSRVPHRVAQKILVVMVHCAAVLAAIYLLFSWIVYFQTDLFPDSSWIELLRSNHAVLIYEAQRQSPWAIPIFLVLCACVIAAVPFALTKIMKVKSPGYLTRGHILANVVVGIALGLFSVSYLSSIQTRHSRAVRQVEKTLLAREVDPIFTLIADLLNTDHETIRPDLDMSLLSPIVPDSEIYGFSRTSEKESKRKLNILYLAVESLRKDVIGKTWQGKEITPHLNALAKRSIVLNNLYAQATHTDYSLPSLLASQYPLRVQGHYYYDRQEPWPRTLIYDHLSHYGYKSAIISSDTTNWGEVRSYLCSPKLDVFFDAENLPESYSSQSTDRGYVTDFKATFREDIKSIPDRVTVDFAMQWLKASFAEERPVFLHSFFYQPHYPYKLPPGTPAPFQPSEINFESTFLWFPPDKMEVFINAYYNAVHETDAQIGRLIAFLEQQGQMDNTIIMLTADHGEAFGEHNKVTHAGPLFNEVVQIPGIIYVPGRDGTVLDYPVEHIDIAPTVCALVGIPPHPGFQGIDVLSDSRPALDERALYLHAEPPGSWKGDALVYQNRWFLLNDRLENMSRLFDLQNDPWQTYDVSNMYPKVVETLNKKLALWRSTQLTYYKFKQYHENYYPPKFTTSKELNK